MSSIEGLMVADYAEIIGNKLYVQGGGWDRLTVNSDFPVQQMVGIAASFLVPWNETNQRLTAQVEIQTEDGEPVGKLEGQFEVGRPAGIRPGQEQRFQIAANIPLTLKKPGAYVIIGRLEGQELRRTHFNVVVGAFLAERVQRQQQDSGSEGEPGVA